MSKPDPRSAEALEWRKLRKTKHWLQLRDMQLTAHPYCRFCEARGKLKRATVVDHITPHKGDADLFFDPANLQSLCKRCHDSAKQSEERLGYSTAIDEDGYPIDPRHPANRD